MDKKGMIDPEVYFVMTISCDKDPHGLCERVAEEWRKKGGGCCR